MLPRAIPGRADMKLSRPGFHFLHTACGTHGYDCTVPWGCPAFPGLQHCAQHVPACHCSAGTDGLALAGAPHAHGHVRRVLAPHPPVSLKRVYAHGCVCGVVHAHLRVCACIASLHVML